MIAESGDPAEAAIASVDAAANFGLEVLAERIQTEKENFTKFAVLGTDARARRADKTSMVMAVSTSRDRCSGRSAVRQAGINLHKLESRPRRGKPFEYLMYVDVMAGRTTPALEAALKEVTSTPRWCACSGPIGRRPTPSRPPRIRDTPGLRCGAWIPIERATMCRCGRREPSQRSRCSAPWGAPSKRPDRPAIAAATPPSPPDQQVTGLTTFRGDPARSWYGEGPVPSDPVIGGRSARRLEDVLDVRGGRRGVFDQAMVRDRLDRPAQRRTQQDGTIEVREGAYDGHYHFLDGRTGRADAPDLVTRDLAKGSATTDPDGYPLYYAGSRDNHSGWSRWTAPSPPCCGRSTPRHPVAASDVEQRLGRRRRSWSATTCSRAARTGGSTSSTPPRL